MRMRVQPPWPLADKHYPSLSPDGLHTSVFSCFCPILFPCLQIPASHQLLFGPLLLLMTIAVMPTVRASLYPPPPASTHDAPSGALQDALTPDATPLTYQPQHHKRLVSLLQRMLQGPAIWTAVLSFLAMVVLPYAIARAWERAALLPRYRAYVTAVTEAAAAGGTSRSGCRTQQADGGGEVEVQDGKDAVRNDMQPAGGAQRSRVASTGSGGSLLGEEAGPWTATPSAAAERADFDGAGCSSSTSHAHSITSPLDRGTSILSVLSTVTHFTHHHSEQQQEQLQQALLREPEDRQQARQADGDVTSPRQRDTTTPPPHILRPRRISLDIDLLMPAALRPRASRLSTVSVDSSRQHQSSSGSASGSGNVNTNCTIRSGSRSGPCSPLYGNLSPYKTKVLSVKVPLRHELGSGAARHSSFPAASARVADAANAAIARHNAAAAAAAAVASSATGTPVAAAGQVPDVAASSLEATLPHVVPRSCVCVEGCVHLLLLVQEHAGGGYGATGLGVDELQQHAGMNNDGVGGAVVQHTTIGLGSSWNMNVAEEEGGLEVGSDAAVEAVVQHVTNTCGSIWGGGAGDGEDGTETEVGGAVEAAVLGMLSQGTVDSSAGGGGGCSGGSSLGSGGAAGLAAVWPPAVSVDEGAGGMSGHAAEEAGKGAAPAGSKKRREADARPVEVVVACGVSLLRGLEAMRCVVAGQVGRGGAADPQDQQGRVYVDCVLPVVGGQGQQQQQQRQRQQQGGDHPMATEAGGEAAERVARLR